MTKVVYLDNNATTPLHPEVKKAYIKAFDNYGNASSMHYLGREARGLIESAREKIASFIGAKNADEITFTSGASESNNTVLNNVLCNSTSCHESGCGCRHIITSAIEHPSVYQTCKEMKKSGTNVTFIPVDKKGIIDINQYKKSLEHKAALVSIMLANNEIGSVQPIKKIVELAKLKRTLVHTDAVQAMGKMDVNVEDLGVDFLSLSGHKLYGPKGIGILYTKKGLNFCPLIRGGHHEFNRRAGTENVPAIIALGKAAEVLQTEAATDIARIHRLRDKLKDGILNNIPDVIINGDVENGLVNTLNVSFKHIEGESIMLYLDLEGIAVSTGSACASGSLEPSYVLLATGIDIEYAHGSIRFSLGRENTEEDIEYTLKVLPGIISKLRKMSPLCKR